MPITPKDLSHLSKEEIKQFAVDLLNYQEKKYKDANEGSTAEYCFYTLAGNFDGLRSHYKLKPLD
jgi:hypothetical protein